MEMIMKRALAKKNGKKGFTLVEVIVVLVILAILAAIAIPALTGYIDKANKRAVITEARTIGVALQTIVSDAYGDGAIAATGTFTGESTLATVFTSYTGDSDYPTGMELGAAIAKVTSGSAYSSTQLTNVTISANKVATFNYVGPKYTVTYNGTTGKYTVS
jgi:type IV pilus assembly protein PilA